MLEIRFTSSHDAGSIKGQLDEALGAIGFARESVTEAAWNDSTAVASGIVVPAASVLSDAKAEEAPKRGRGRPPKQDAAPEQAPAATEAPLADKPQISANPENRVDPAATQAAAPAETAVASAPAALTKDDVRGAMGGYVRKFGTPAALEDGPKILGVAKISDLPDDQDALKKAIAQANYALEENPYGRTVVNG